MPLSPRMRAKEIDAGNEAEIRNKKDIHLTE
jgi:hypothetical protein